MGYDSLRNFFKTNFALMQHHKYSLYDIEHMLPWERFVYVDLLKDYIKQKNEEARDKAAAQKGRK